MSDLHNADGAAGSDSSVLADLIDGLTAKMQADEPIDWEGVARQYPQHADEIIRLRPALGLLGELSKSGPAELSGIAAPAVAEESLATGVLGDFRIVREVGRGAMGVVYEAEQVSLGRRVALKVLPFAATMDSRALQRFQNEARAAACLHHTNVVPVYYVGCERGIHFYAMQFIDGRTVADLIRELRRPAEQASAPEQTTAHTPAEGVAAPKPDTEPAARQSTRATQSAAMSREFFRRAAGWGVQAAEALDHAHHAAIVHRDIKPGNLLLDGRGQLWVADFGLAHVRQGEAGLTMTGDLVGTLRYMSPEQALAKRVPIDHRTDVYSLGATLYELLTLRPALTGKDRQELLRQIAFEEPTPPRRLNKAIPQELEVIVLKAMEKNPADRYATAQEMADDLRRWLEHHPIRARPPTMLQRLRKWGQRHRGMLGVAAVFALILVLLGVAGLAADDARVRGEKEKTGAAKKQAEDNEQAAKKQKDRAERQRDAARRNAYFLSFLQAQSDYDAGDIRRVLQLLDDQRPEQGLEDLRGWEWRHLQAICRQDLFTLACQPQDVLPPIVRWNPDGRRLAARIAEAGEGIKQEPGTARVRPDQLTAIRVWDGITGQELFTLHGEAAWITSLEWSPDGKQLAALATDGTVKVWDAAGKASLTLHGPGGGDSCLAWSPDGTRLASASTNGALKVWDVARGQELAALRKEGADQDVMLYALTWAQDSRRLALAAAGPNPGSQIQVWDVVTAQQILTVPLSHSGVIGKLRVSVAWSPDGKRLAAVDSEAGVKVCDAATGQELLRLPAGGGLYSLAWSPDGMRLAATAGDHTIKVWDATTGQLGLTLPGQSDVSRSVAWSPDGRHLASAGADRLVKVWDAETGIEQLTLRGHMEKVQEVAWSPDGGRLVTGSADGTIKVWDATAPDGDGIAINDAGGQSMAWHPDSKRLAVAEHVGSEFRIRVINASQGNEEVSYSCMATLNGPGNSTGVTACANAVTWSPDGMRLATGGGVGVIWDAFTGRQGQVFGRPEEHILVKSIAWSPDGTRILLGGGAWRRQDATPATPAPLELTKLLKVWDVATGQECLNLVGHTDVVVSVAWSPDGRRLASAGQDESVKIWDAANGQLLFSLHGNRESNFSSDLRWVAWSPDSRHLASVAEGHTVKIWDTTTGQEVFTLRGHSGPIAAVAWHPDGRRLASAGMDKMVKLWDATTGQEVLTLRLPARPVGTIGWSPDGERLAARCGGVVMVWDTSPQRVLRPGMVRIKNCLAWFLVTCANPRQRDPAQALELADQTVREVPREGNFWNTLGVARYRSGDCKGGLEAVTRGMELNKGGTSFDFFLLAMAHWRLGAKDQAKEWYDKAIAWMDKNMPNDEELRRFRTEAAGLLGVEQKND